MCIFPEVRNNVNILRQPFGILAMEGSKGALNVFVRETTYSEAHACL